MRLRARCAGLNKRKLYERVRISQTNVRFGDLILLVEAFGFVLARQRGSHLIYKHNAVERVLNLQPERGDTAKPYQVREFLRMVQRYDLAMEDE